MSFDFSLITPKLVKALEHVRADMATLRTGKATPQLLDSVTVEAYGGFMKVQELAGVSAPDPTLLVVTPWDKSVLHAIEKAIASAGLNLNPVVNGDMIRIAVPSLTQERRLEMVKLLSQKLENGRVMIRTIRTDTKKLIEKQKGTEGVSEDDITTDLEKLETLTKTHLDQLEELGKKKEIDLMTV